MFDRKNSFQALFGREEDLDSTTMTKADELFAKKPGFSTAGV